MEKISGILPNSPRIKAVDMEQSQPVRRGVPAFGQRVVGDEPQDRVSRSSVNRAMLVDTIRSYRPRDVQNSKIVDKIADQFFMTEMKDSLTPAADEEMIDSILAGPVAAPVAKRSDSYELESFDYTEPEQLGATLDKVV